MVIYTIENTCTHACMRQSVFLEWSGQLGKKKKTPERCYFRIVALLALMRGRKMEGCHKESTVAIPSGWMLYSIVHTYMCVRASCTTDKQNRIKFEAGTRGWPAGKAGRQLASEWVKQQSSRNICSSCLFFLLFLIFEWVTDDRHLFNFRLLYTIDLHSVK